MRLRRPARHVLDARQVHEQDVREADAREAVLGRERACDDEVEAPPVEIERERIPDGDARPARRLRGEDDRIGRGHEVRDLEVGRGAGHIGAERTFRERIDPEGGEGPPGDPWRRAHRLHHGRRVPNAHLDPQGRHQRLVDGADVAHDLVGRPSRHRLR